MFATHTHTCGQQRVRCSELLLLSTGMFAASLPSAVGGRNTLKFIGTLVRLLSWINCFTSPPNMRAVLRIEAIRPDCRCSDSTPCLVYVTSKLMWWWKSAFRHVEWTREQIRIMEATMQKAKDWLIGTWSIIHVVKYRIPLKRTFTEGCYKLWRIEISAKMRRCGFYVFTAMGKIECCGSKFFRFVLMRGELEDTWSIIK